MKNLLKYFSLTVAITISSNAYSISSGVYKLSSGGKGIESKTTNNQSENQTTTMGDNSSYTPNLDQQIIPNDNNQNNDINPELPATFTTGFQPDTYKCVSSRLPKVKGSYFIFYPEPPECPLIEYRDKKDKIIEEGCYEKKPNRNGADYTIMSLKTSQPHRYEIVLIDQTQGKKFNINHLVDGEFELLCKAKKLK